MQGKHDAALIGRYFQSENFNLDIAISSPAVRARETAQLLLGSDAHGCQVHYDSHVYEASLHDLMCVISELDEGTQTVLIVGHNPGMGELLISLTSLQVGMGTAHLARITLDIKEWCKCEPGVGRLNWIVSPAALEGRTFS